MTEPAPYELYAVRYARVSRRAGENFIGGDPHDGPMEMDYFVWAAVSRQRTFVIDMGFNAAAAQRRKREFLRSPAEGLRLFGIDANTVKDVVVTHMHYDHIGNFDQFPNAIFHIQDKEMAFATGRFMCHEPLRATYEADEVAAFVRLVYSNRVQFHDGTAELAPGFTLHWIGGHTAGLQIVRVWTQRGWIVLASDASHYYANMEQARPFPIVFHVGDMLEGHKTLRQLADSPRHIIPGHDPLVMTRYPAEHPDLKGIVARVDLDPLPWHNSR